MKQSREKFMDHSDKEPEQKSLTFIDVLVTTLAGTVGVQSERNKNRDFNHENVIQFIFAGVLFTMILVVLVVLVMTVVKMALN